jgi:hypothetical protein
VARAGYTAAVRPCSGLTSVRHEDQALQAAPLCACSAAVSVGHLVVHTSVIPQLHQPKHIAWRTLMAWGMCEHACCRDHHLQVVHLSVGRWPVMGQEPLQCEDCHFSGHFLCGSCLYAGAQTNLHQCTFQVGVRACGVENWRFYFQLATVLCPDTINRPQTLHTLISTHPALCLALCLPTFPPVQNLCGDRSYAGKTHPAVSIHEHDNSAELKGCVIENMQGDAAFHVRLSNQFLCRCHATGMLVVVCNIRRQLDATTQCRQSMQTHTRMPLLVIRCRHSVVRPS